MLKKIMRLYVLIALSIIPMMARADGEVTLDSIIGAAHNGTDKSLALLGFILGHGNGVNFSGGGRFEQVFLILNGIALVLGLVYFVFVAVSGVAQTAHDGEFLGKRYSSIWLPIRFSIGTMSIVPIVGGWGIAQVAMLWMTVMGVGSANLVAGAMASSVFDQEQNNPTFPVPSVKLAAIQLLEANICMESINKGIDEARTQYQIQIESTEEIRPYIKDNQIRYVNEGSGFFNASHSCGQVEFSLDDFGSWTTKMYNAVAPTSTASQGDPLYGTKVAGLNQMQSILNASAKKFVDGGAFDEAAIDSAALAYQNAMSAGMKDYKTTQNISDQKKKADDILKSGGWITLGALYQSYATYATSVRNSLSKIPEVSKIDGPDSFDDSYNRYWQDGAMRFNAVKSRIAEDYLNKAERGQLQTLSLNSLNPFSNKDSPGLWMVEAIKNMANSAGGGSTTYPDPLVGLKNVGDTIIIAGESIFVAMKAGPMLAKLTPVGRAASTASSMKSKADAVSGAGENEDKGGIASVMSTVMFVLFFVGILLSIWVPMIPFVTWVAAVISWFAVVMESIFSAPLWAMAHFEAEGEGMGQRTGHGYMFAVNLLLRPMLMVLGFLAAWLILTATANLVSTLYMIAVGNAQIDEAGGTSMTGIISVPGFIIVYGIIMMMLVNKSFELIHAVPENVTAWLGGHVRGNHGQGGEKDVHGMIVGAIHKSQVLQPPKTPGGGGDGGGGAAPSGKGKIGK